MSKILNVRAAPLVLAAPLAAPAIVHMEAYSNGLTNMIPTFYRVIDTVSRELTGFIPSVMINGDGAERVAIGQNISWHKSGKLTASDVQQQMTVDTPSDINPGTDTMTISKSRKVDFYMTGEDQRKLQSPGVGPAALAASTMAQALRTLVGEIEQDMAVEMYSAASRAAGTAGTTPFGSDIGATADVRKILDDNGAPPGLRAMVINTATASNMRKIGHLNKVNEAGDGMSLRQGELDNIHNFSIKESGCTLFRTGHTKGTASGATTNNAGYAIGATVITLASAGTGTILAGDHITFAGDTNKYVVASGDADVSNGGTITLCAPGLQVAIAASDTNITVGNSYMPNVAFSQDAGRLLIRPPSKPEQGDARIDEYIIVDPRSGLPFEVSLWAGQRMVVFQVAAAWGVKNVKEENTALLLG
jgi:hypothetical protein